MNNFNSMRILHVAGHLPSPRATQAGSKTSYHMARCFSARHEVHLLSYFSKNEIATHVDSDMSIYSSWQMVPVNNWLRLKGILSSPTLPVPIAARNSRDFRDRLRKILAQYQFDAVILDHSAQFQYCDELQHIPVVVGCAHDIMTQGWQRRAEAARNPLSRLLLRFECNRMQNWETKIFEQLDAVLPQSPKDGDLVVCMAEKARVFVIQGWLSRLEASQAEYGNAVRIPNSIVYYGALNRNENVDAAEYLAEEILPKIQRQVPDVKLYLAGSHSEKLAARYGARPEIEVTGFLQDPIGFLATMQVALLPLRLGAGIKAKTLECMSAGIAVVTTDVGAEGVGGCAGKDYLVASAPEELAALTVDLLRNPEKARTMGRSGRDYVFREYDFDRRIRELEPYLENLLKTKRKTVGEGTARATKGTPETIGI
jgi:glycosyltransferase involved in cell wall biosynthesis